MVLIDFVKGNTLNDVNVGEKLREIRSKRNFSLRVLAEKSELSINTLSLIENGKSSPSVSTLQKLANALDVPIASFFSAASDNQQVISTQKSNRAKLKAGKVNIEILGKGFEYKRFQQYIVNFKPGDRSGNSNVVHMGLETIFIFSGSVKFSIGEAKYLLSSGDHIIFNSSIPHHWHTDGNSEGQMLITFLTTDELLPANLISAT